ncbi:hypothetical protein CPB85DRAFT_1560113 [Mucidula mucida]|nr:hypothetical protein CPB85DRAFT_1567911 [Mucidula mucida]KAF8887506.1 hypothetical protein CPB85DRAFT_1566641 [Mucidula mucida]KAF8915771.1 hypothetical protein CPB85DRAFT_1560113 [Mucidula mucida]
MSAWTFYALQKYFLKLSALTDGVYCISSAVFTQPSVLFGDKGVNLPAKVDTFNEDSTYFQWKITSVDADKNTYTINNQGNTSYPNAVPDGASVVSAPVSNTRNWVIKPTGASDEYTINYNGTDRKPVYWTLPSATSDVTLSKESAAIAQKNWIFHKVSGAV